LSVVIAKELSEC